MDWEFNDNLSCATINAFYKSHQYEGRMSPRDSGMGLIRTDGYLICALRVLNLSNGCRIRHVFTAPEYRGQGCATRLLDAVTQKLLNAKTPLPERKEILFPITLVCAKETVNLYKQAGFMEVVHPCGELTQTELKLLRSGKYCFMEYKLRRTETKNAAKAAFF
tara:strand:+ start:747 stop:1235 length:489 start_codon:yes stop_codon:yes gene_type:complete